MSLEPCTCGDAHPHEVMRRSTANGIHIHLWSDGMVTAAMGYRLLGVPSRRPRTAEAQRLALTAGRLFLDQAQLHDSADLGPVYAAAEKAAREDGLPGTLRRHLAESKSPILLWKILSTDRGGKPVERVAYLPRLLYPGLVVWDFCGGPGSKDGRYVLMRRMAGRRDDQTFQPTGFAFRNLAELWKHLRSAS